MIFSEPHERRRFSRINFDGKATLSQGNQRYPVQLLDISVKGALVKIESLPLTAHQSAALQIELEDNTQIDMQMTVARQRANYLGLSCTSIDLESATHLRRLIELNLASPDAVDRVLEELLIPVTSHSPEIRR